MRLERMIGQGLALLALAAGCSTTTAANDDDDATPYPEVDLYDFDSAQPWDVCPERESLPEEVVEIRTFDRDDQYFGDQNLREIEVTAEFPDSSEWAQVGMWFDLRCPEGGVCDHWDRTGSVSLVLNPEAPPEERQSLELLRHITPYRRAMCQYIDVTELAPLLTGTRTLTSWIDTWVGPGHSDGDGWVTTVKFFFYPGAPEGADEVINVWGRRSITVGEVEPESNVDSQIEPFSFTLPEDTSRVVAHLVTTGHSFGNTLNCAEFCQMRQDLSVNGEVFSVNPWRSDCDQNPVSPQLGTWEYNRNGWCPGAVAEGDRIDITEAITAGAENVIDFDILLANGQEYDNTSPVDLLPNEYVSLKLYVYR